MGLNLKTTFSVINVNLILKLVTLPSGAFFYSNNIICFNCKQRIDLWDILKRQFDSILISFGCDYSLLGCQGKMVKIGLKLNKLDLSKEINKGKLLYINYILYRMVMDFF